MRPKILKIFPKALVYKCLQIWCVSLCKLLCLLAVQNIRLDITSNDSQLLSPQASTFDKTVVILTKYHS